ncbi:helix-turn-helix domain-containing protein [Paracoccus shandongensis]|uniref:helix-turn-helix domain-containing protein n=1 Tax=Paracoccus shandongensis TaxID=2816048 RepID=UPI001A8C520F|nr:helix-turn-helix domain-containing protein [Paracoccus shandongensis]
MASLHSPKPTGRRLSLSESREIFAAFQRGDSVTVLARRFGVSRPTVYRAIEKNGRPGHPSANSARVAIRLTPDERATFDGLAGRLGFSRAALGRRVLRLAAGYLEPEPDLVEAVQDLSRQIKAVGGNLNQIAAHLNREVRLQGRASPHADQRAQIELSERALKALAKEVDALFVHAAKRRKARVEALLRQGNEG